MELPDESCGSCRFFLAEAKVCRRFPAVPVATPVGVATHFPSMLAEGWCGEFARRRVIIPRAEAN